VVDSLCEVEALDSVDWEVLILDSVVVDSLDSVDRGVEEDGESDDEEDVVGVSVVDWVEVVIDVD